VVETDRMSPEECVELVTRKLEELGYIPSRA
jgi:hypothetical protein